MRNRAPTCGERVQNKGTNGTIGTLTFLWNTIKNPNFEHFEQVLEIWVFLYFRKCEFSLQKRTLFYNMQISATKLLIYTGNVAK